MWHSRRILLVMAGTCLFFVSTARADSLQLKNGNFVQGKYLGGTERAVQFEANGKVRIYDIDEILSISFATASADGGIPSNDDDQKPSTKTELNAVETNKVAGLRTAIGNDEKAYKAPSRRVSVKQNQCSRTFQRPDARTSRRRPAQASFANDPENLDSKARVSAIAAHPTRPVVPHSSALSD
jgi:hypothetical protein